MDFGLFHYLWVKAMKENKTKKDAEGKNPRLLDVLGDL